MTNPLLFALAAIALLSTPGPTNTLLFTSGAAVGVRRSLPLLLAELSGYLISIAVLSLVVGPLLAAQPWMPRLLRCACALLLAFFTVRLWRAPAESARSAAPILMRHVFSITLLNPKGLVFAFAILPRAAPGEMRVALSYLGALCVLITSVGGAWISLGAVLRSRAGSSLEPLLVRRGGAVVLGIFAALLGASAIWK